MALPIFILMLNRWVFLKVTKSDYRNMCHQLHLFLILFVLPLLQLQLLRLSISQFPVLLLLGYAVEWEC